MRAVQCVSTAASVLSLFLIAAPLLAESTEHEKWALELRRSDDHRIELLGNRWFTLVKRQEWTDVTGKYTVQAKYLSHDPEFKTVTLLAIQRTDEGRVEQQVTVAFDKLDATAQARVKRIARLKPIIEEKLADVEAAAAAEAEENQAAGRGMDDRGGTRGYERVDPREMDRSGGRGEPRDAERRPPVDPRGRGRQPRVDPRAMQGSNRPARPGLEQPTPPDGNGAVGDPLVEIEPGGAPDGTPAGGSPRPDYVVDVPHIPADFPAPPRQGWRDLYRRQIGQNIAEVRTIPEQPVAGRPTKLLLIFTTVRQEPRPKVSIRFDNPVRGGQEMIADPDAGAPWTEMEVVGGTYFEPRAGGDVALHEPAQVLATQQPGETHYQIGLNFPPGNTGIAVRIEIDGVGVEAFSSEALNVNVAALDPHSDPRGDPRGDPRNDRRGDPRGDPRAAR